MSSILCNDQISSARAKTFVTGRASIMAKIAKTGDRKKVMDTNKSTDCPKCSKPTRIVKRVKDRECSTRQRALPGLFVVCTCGEIVLQIKETFTSPAGLT